MDMRVCRPTWLCLWMQWLTASKASVFSKADMALILLTSSSSQGGLSLGCSPVISLPGWGTENRDQRWAPSAPGWAPRRSPRPPSSHSGRAPGPQGPKGLSSQSLCRKRGVNGARRPWKCRQSRADTSPAVNSGWRRAFQTGRRQTARGGEDTFRASDVNTGRSNSCHALGSEHWEPVHGVSDEGLT